MTCEIGYSKGMHPLVSVIIPTYNSGVYLKEAVESALDQDYPNLEEVNSTYNNLSELPYLPKLKYLFCNNNKIVK